VLLLSEGRMSIDKLAVPLMQINATTPWIS
jgi:hypothetical protein